MPTTIVSGGPDIVVTGARRRHAALIVAQTTDTGGRRPQPVALVTEVPDGGASLESGTGPDVSTASMVNATRAVPAAPSSGEQRRHREGVQLGPVVLVAP